MELTHEASIEDREPPTQPTGFFTLPPEIRFRIYKLLMVSTHSPLSGYPLDDKRGIRSRIEFRDDCCRRPLSYAFSTNLFRTCRQLHNEATHYFYSHVNRRLYVSDFSLPSLIWPHKGWSYRHLGYLGIELLIQANNGDFIPSIRSELLDLCSELAVFRFKRLIIHHIVSYDNTESADAYEHLAALKSLAGSLGEVVVGVLRTYQVERDTTAYHAIKDALCEVPKWTFPLKDGQYAD